MSWVPVAPGLRFLEVDTPTVPPATTINVAVLGHQRLTVVDPGSPWAGEQERLFAALTEQGRVERIVLTHHHPDHIGGVEALRKAAGGVPVLAHPITARLVEGEVRVDGLLHDGDLLDCDGVLVDLLHTPGHASGHLVLHDRSSGVMVAGDMVAGVGTIVIDPDEGDLGHYLASLARMQKRRPTRLVPSHGPVLDEAEAVLGFYVAHRHMRSDQIRTALDRDGASSAEGLVPRVYGPALDPSLTVFAAMQIGAHLRWLRGQGLVWEDGLQWRIAR